MSNQTISPHTRALTEILITTTLTFYKLDEVQPGDILTATTSSLINVIHNLSENKAGEILDMVIGKLIEHRDGLIKDVDL